MAAFIYTCCVFGLLALYPLLGIAGFALFGPAGVIAGLAIATFLTIWAGCYYMDRMA